MKLTKRKNGRWQYNYTVENEKKPRAFYSSEPNERKAEKEIMNKIFNYESNIDKGKLFCSIADAWNTECRLTNSEINYKKNIRAAYNRITDYFGDDIYISEITVRDINVFLKRLANQKYAKKPLLLTRMF